MSAGGFVAGVVVAILAGLATRFSNLKEDANFAGFYLLALALGVLLISRSGSQVDLVHILFGSVLAVDTAGLLLMGMVASVSLLGLAVIYRPLPNNKAGRRHLFCQSTMRNLVQVAARKSP